MGNVQSLLSFGAMLILALSALNFNGAVLSNSTTEIENKVILTAFSLADDLIEEMKVRAFDAVIDDFNNYTKIVSAPHAENYNVSCSVQYVNGDNPDQVVTTQTFYKKATVTVSSPYM